MAEFTDNNYQTPTDVNQLLSDFEAKHPWLAAGGTDAMLSFP